jgi:hypothetical protein
MKSWLLGLLLCAQFSHAAEAISPDCQQALLGLQSYIGQQSASLVQADLETSQAADAVRLSCDGSAAAYQQSLGQITSRFIPPASAEPAGISARTEGILSLVLMIALIASSSSGVVVFGSGNGLYIGPN